MSGDSQKHVAYFGAFDDLKPGDKVIRMLAGTIPVECTIEKVEDGIIYMHGGWTFDQATGIEEDEDLGWGVKFGHTGSFLVRDE